MEDNKATLYYCNHCKLLLFKLDERLVSYDTSELCDDGVYDYSYGSGEKDHDAWLCPVCSSTEFEADVEEDGKPGFLVELEVPESIVPELIKLWKKLEAMYNSGANEEGDVCEDGHLYEYGVPLNHPELKVMVTEYLI